MYTAKLLVMKHSTATHMMLYAPVCHGANQGFHKQEYDIG
jgi:hypothetical protein